LGAGSTAFVTTGQASGTNYTSGGSALTNVTPTTSGTTAIVDFADLTFSNATVTARGCLIYNTNNSNKAVCAIDFGGDKTSTAGDFTIEVLVLGEFIPQISIYFSIPFWFQTIFTSAVLSEPNMFVTYRSDLNSGKTTRYFICEHLINSVSCS
jgi:hypothetical protein